MTFRQMICRNLPQWTRSLRHVLVLSKFLESILAFLSEVCLECLNKISFLPLDKRFVFLPEALGIY